MIKCYSCKSSNIAKKGFRYNKTGKKQKYQCVKCKAWFILDDGFKKMRFKNRIIVKAVHQHIDGLSLDKVKNHLWRHEGVKVTKWTISEWTSKYGEYIKKTFSNPKA